MTADQREQIAAANRLRFPRSFAFLSELREVFGPECTTLYVVEGAEFTGPVPFDQLPSFVGPRQPFSAGPVKNELAFFEMCTQAVNEDIRVAKLAAMKRGRK